MSQIEELQGRITAALDRISQGLEGMSADGADADEMDALRQQLEDEQTANAQLEERLKRMKEKLDAAEAAAEAAVQEHRDGLAKLDGDLQSLRRANAQLRDNNKALREAIEAGVAEPHLINKAMLSELEGLRAARAADRAETEAVMAELGRIAKAAAASSEDA
ncbi:hypothetical protein EI983_10550 [Roseovarius faecimaris]|uniref:Colicin transporter n=1 Tax=Roseovarius faecimaris TaxID=2494550 RepID=A0A6I6IT34_9RHOB|nr:hypothetical protein [Roseovarius faecimaris]QGX98687.1 hypothetical protein EI983_10550 [Roseovarius faecimaris]